MRIQNINNFFYNRISQPIVHKNVNNYCQDVFCKNPAFCAKDFEFCDNDKKFINAVVANLRLSEDDKKIIEHELSKFMREKKIKSMDEINIEDDSYQEAELIDNIYLKLHLSDNEYGILIAEIFDRIDNKNNYNPKNRKFDKDIILMNGVLQSYGFDISATDLMKQEAEKKGYRTLFDIFKTENNPIQSETYKKMHNQYNENRLCDLVIHLNSLANCDEKSRKFESLYNEYIGIQDKLIANDIVSNFHINSKYMNDIIKYVEKRSQDGVQNIQIAFEIADRFNLPKNAEEKIIKIIEFYCG